MRIGGSMGDQQGFLEKRQHERLTAHFKVTFREIESAEADRLIRQNTYKDITTPPVTGPGMIKDVMTVVAENISLGGMMLVAPKPFTKGSTLSVEFTVSGAPIPVKAIGVVARAGQQPNARG